LYTTNACTAVAAAARVQIVQRCLQRLLVVFAKKEKKKKEEDSVIL